MRNYILLLLSCVLISVNAQTTNENISQLKDKSGDVYFRITKSDSIYKFECARGYDKISREKTDYEKGIFQMVFTTTVTKSGNEALEFLELDIKFVLKDSLSLTSMYNGINNMFLSLPEKKQDYTRENTDSIFPLITLSVDSLNCI